jgi:hypothetical protein
MASLSTVYIVSVVLASLAGVGSAFIGNRIYPIKGGAELPPPSPEEVSEAAEKASQLAKRYAEAEQFQRDEAQEQPKTSLQTDEPSSIQQT